MADPLKSRRWQTARAAYLTQAATRHAPCALCGAPIDYQLPGTHQWGPTVDHIHERARGGDVFDPANWQPAHRHCNTVRGAHLGGQRYAARRRPSRAW